MQTSACIAGVDVAKAELVIALQKPEQGEPASANTYTNCIPNTNEAIALWLTQQPVGSTVAMESSGRYHQKLAQMAHDAGMRVFVLNARDVQLYAKAISARGKTDRLDAGVIARYVHEHHRHLKTWQPTSSVADRVQRLLDRRLGLTQQLVCVRQSLQEMPELEAAAASLEQTYKMVLKRIDELVEQLLRQEEPLHQSAKRLQGITGFGLQACARLAALFTRIAFSNANAVVAYSGLDPRPSDSGTKRGRRRLSKRGPSPLRRQMYLVAFAASHSKVYGGTYKKLRERFSTTESMVILARKLLRVAWAVWKSGKEFDPSKIAALPVCAKT